MGCVGGRSWLASSEADWYASSASDALVLRSSADWNSARYLGTAVETTIASRKGSKKNRS